MLHQQAGKGPVGGVGCRFKVSIDDVKAQQPSVLFPFKTIKNQPVEKPQVNAKCSAAGVKLHLRLHSLNCAGTLSWQRLTFSWKTLRKKRVRGQTVGSDWGPGIKRRALQHNPLFFFCAPLTHLECPKSSNLAWKALFLFILARFFVLLFLRESRPQISLLCRRDEILM